jgi:ComF family protein
MRSYATEQPSSAWTRRPTSPDLLHRLADRARTAGRSALDLALPPHCLACGEPVLALGEFCADCFRQTGFISEPCCIRCGVPFISLAQGGVDLLCPTCRTTPPTFDRARAALRYDAQARRLLLPLKYADRVEMTTLLVRQMARAGGALLRQADVLVPVPLHRRRLFMRRYNQAALLGHGLARGAHKRMLPDALVRTRPTANLGDKSARERASEVAGAFIVRPSRAATLVGRRVLLIDDVMTSGATANACALALMRAGAAGVDVLTAARVSDPRLG